MPLIGTRHKSLEARRTLIVQRSFPEYWGQAENRSLRAGVPSQENGERNQLPSQNKVTNHASTRS